MCIRDSYNVANSIIPKGAILDKINPTRGYAMALTGKRLLREADDSRDNNTSLYRGWWKLDKRLPYGLPQVLPTEAAIESTAETLEKNAEELGIDKAKAQALAEELLAVYQENYQRTLEQQRRHRAKMLPEVNRQIDCWLKDMETRNPKWLKEKWPAYPDYE